MLAVQLTEWGRPPVVREIDDPAPTGEQLLIKVGAAGLCRSDLSVMDSPTDRFDYPLPLTLGHEVAGTVVDTGPDGDHTLLGKDVVVHGIWSCRACRNCRRGRQNYCLDLAPRPDGRLSPIGNGLGRPGGLAELMLVPSADVLVPTGSLPAEQAAPLADAGLTAYHAIRTHRDLIDSETVAVVVGIGGLGHLAVQILRAFGVRHITAVDNRAQAHDLAIELGAQTCHVSLDDAAADIIALGGADVIFDFVGAPATIAPAPALLGPGGRIVVVGTAGGRLAVGKDLGMPSGWQINAPFWGTTADLREVVSLAQAGTLHSEVTRFGFADIPEAYRQLRSGAFAGRGVLVPGL